MSGLGLGLVAQLAIVTHAPDTVRACDAIELSVAISAPASGSPRLVAPSLRPFELLRGAGAPRVTRDPASRGSIIAEYRFVLTTDQVGRFTIPPFEVSTTSERIASRPLTLAVLPARRGLPSVVARARVDTGTELGLRTAAAETVYVGQQAPYEVAVFLNQVARERLRRNPTFYPPEMQAMLAYDLPASAQGFRQHSGSQCFDALVYRRALFPLIAGRLVIPPAQLVYSTALSSTSLFSREESHEIQTDSVVFVAVEPPLTGRPPEYVGAVGAVRLDARLDSIASRVGDPMLFTVRVTGTGNVKLFPRPSVKIPWAGLVAADERVSVDSANARVGGAKEFDWVLTPRIAGEFDVPPVRYGYFDPGRRRYDVAVARGDRLRVASGALASADTGQIDGPLPIRTAWAGAVAMPPQSFPGFWLALALMPLPALVSRVRRRAARPAAWRAAAAAAVQGSPAALESIGGDPVALRREFVRALARRLGCTPEAFTHPGALERELLRAGVSASTAERAERQLRELDVAAYAHAGAITQHSAKAVATLVRDVDAEALARAELPFWIPALFLAFALAGAGAAIAADTAPAAFASGVSSYLREDYAAARDAFADAVALEPRSVDSWANYGTASWALADTATAVAAWRSALGLEPGAADLQTRIGLPRPIDVGSPGWVPALPANASVWAFAALWLAAWTLAWLWRRDPRALTRRAVPIAIAALVVGVVAMEIEGRVAGNGVAVVRRALVLTTDPAVGMDRGPAIGTGEIVRIRLRRGAWAKVVASDGREGWVPATQLIFVAERRLQRD